MANEIKFTKFPTELSNEQLLDLADYDQEIGYGSQEVIILSTGFWLTDGSQFEKRKDHYLKLYSKVVNN